MGHPLWPLYDLRLRTPALELRVPTEDELGALCRVARAGIHDPADMPFTVPWTDQPSPQFEREFLKFHWGVRSRWSPEHWTLGLAVFHDGEPMGFQDLAAEEFAVLQEVHTGSWLGQAFQGRGYGKQMRAAVLHLAFAELGAVAAHSDVFADNAASVGVSRTLGYEPNGVGRKAPRGEPREFLDLRLTRKRWESRRHCEVEVAGLDTCRDMFGIG
jgi:RimJ/RimL family protein N-acetyltransferase